MNKMILGLALAALLSACATTDAVNTNNTASAQEEKVYVTGSNLPRKDKDRSGVTTASAEAIREAANGKPQVDPTAGTR